MAKTHNIRSGTFINKKIEQPVVNFLSDNGGESGEASNSAFE